MKTCTVGAFLIVIAGIAASPAKAQVATNLDPNQTYLAITKITPGAGGVCVAGPGSFCVDPAQGIPLSFFATSASLAAQFSKMHEGIAITAAMGDAIPNPGDRFAIRLNAAGFSGEAAGGLSVSYAFADRARVSLNYGQGRSQTVVSGGLTLSFH